MKSINKFKKEFPDLSPQRLRTAYYLIEVLGVSEELKSPCNESSCDREAILSQIINNIEEDGNYIP